MNPERKQSPEMDANRIPDDEADKAMKSTAREKMDASADLSAEAKDAEMIQQSQAGLEQMNAEIDARNLSQEEKDAEAVKKAQAGLESLSAEIDERQDNPQHVKDTMEVLDKVNADVDARAEDRAKVVELGEKMLKDMSDEAEKKAGAKAADRAKVVELGEKMLSDAKKDEVVELSDEDLEDDDDDVMEVTDADIISHTEDNGNVETSAPSMESLNKKMKERVAENETEEKFFEEGANMDEASRMSATMHAKTTQEMGYVERASGDLVRGEARSADINEAAKRVDLIKEELKAAQAAHDSSPWYKKLFSRGAVKRLESQLSDAEDKLAEAKSAMNDPENYKKAKQMQSERKG